MRREEIKEMGTIGLFVKIEERGPDPTRRK
jgi:hypothetical protein